MGNGHPPAHPDPTHSPETGTGHRWQRSLCHWPPPQSAPAGKHHAGYVNMGGHRGAAGPGKPSCHGQPTRSPRQGLGGTGATLRLAGVCGGADRFMGASGDGAAPVHIHAAAQGAVCPQEATGCHWGLLQGQLGGDRVVWVAMGDSRQDSGKAWGDMGRMMAPLPCLFQWSGPWAGGLVEGLEVWAQGCEGDTCQHQEAQLWHLVPSSTPTPGLMGAYWG